jgi:DNA-binding response OmpR family regulator
LICMAKHPDVVAGSVVVVEDEPLIRMWLADVLEAAGYEVKTAGNAEEGITHLKSVPCIFAPL